jgi:selenocysteine lyase/cysteine desulfurase
MSLVEEHILALTQILIDEFQKLEGVRFISPIVVYERAGIVTIQPPKEIDPERAFKALMDRRIIVSLREGKLRYSPHFYNSVEEMTTVVEATKECFQKLAS